jgi:DNA-binding LytR/AlgR family response regulator
MKSNLSVLIVDDEPHARHLLRKILEAHDAVTVCYEAEDGLQALRMLDQHACDIVFLDVNMPGPSGITIGAEMSARRPAPLLIFVTGYVHYAADAFDLNAVDYVRKGAGELRVYRALGKALDRLRLENPLAPLGDVRLWAKSQDGDTRLINVMEIVWVEAREKKVFVHTCQSETIEINKTIENLMTLLPSEHFMRVHRAAIVAIARIKMRVDFSGTAAQLLMDDESVVDVGPKYLPALKDRFSH